MECLVCADLKQNVNECKGERCSYSMCAECMEKYDRSTCPACQRENCFDVPVRKSNINDCLPFNTVCILLVLVVLGGAYGVGVLFCTFVLTEPLSPMTLLYGYGIFAGVGWACLAFAVLCSNQFPFAHRVVEAILNE